MTSARHSSCPRGTGSVPGTDMARSSPDPQAWARSPSRIVDPRTSRCHSRSARRPAEPPDCACSSRPMASVRSAHARRCAREPRSHRRRSHISKAAEARQLLDVEAALDRGLDVELLGDVGLLADQLARPARKRLPRSFDRFPDVDRAPALGRLVGDPELQPQALQLLELVDRLVHEVAAQLGDRRLRIGQIPEDEPDDHSVLSGRSAGLRRFNRSRKASRSASPLTFRWYRGRRGSTLTTFTRPVGSPYERPYASASPISWSLASDLRRKRRTARD